MAEFGILFIVSGVYAALFSRVLGPMLIAGGACLVAVSPFMGG